MILEDQNRVADVAKVPSVPNVMHQAVVFWNVVVTTPSVRANVEDVVGYHISLGHGRQTVRDGPGVDVVLALGATQKVPEKGREGGHVLHSFVLVVFLRFRVDDSRRRIGADERRTAFEGFVFRVAFVVVGGRTSHGRRRGRGGGGNRDERRRW